MSQSQGPYSPQADDGESGPLRWEWSLQKVSWALLILIVGAALTGLLGHGPLSSAVAGAPGSELWVEYHRFERQLAPSDLRVHARTDSGQGGTIRVGLDRAYVEQVQFERIDPEPLAVEARGERYVFVFSHPDGSQPATVIFRFRPDVSGFLQTRVALSGGTEVRLSQFSYP